MSEQQESAHHKREPITSQTVLDSIQDLEPWSKQLKGLMAQDKEGITSFLDRAVATYQEFEQTAQRPESHLISLEEAELIKAIWIISAPGTYFKRNKNDRYQDKEWAWWTDRRRINYAFEIGRQLAEIKAGRKIEGNTPADLELLKEFGPLLIYNGRPDENNDIAEAVKTPWLKIPEGLGYPQDKVYIIYPFTKRFNNKDYNLLDQIQTFHLPGNIQTNPGDEIGIVAHAPQAVRVLYSLSGYDQAFPQGVTARMLILPTPKEGIPEYPTQELRAIIYYRFIASPPAVGDKPFPYKI